MTSPSHGKSTQRLDSKTPTGAAAKKKGKGIGDKKIAEDEFMAAAIGDVEWLKQSLRGSKGAINFDKNGLTPIHLAAIHGRLDCLKYLIEKQKVDVNLPSSTGWGPLHLCISNQTGKRAFQCLLYLLEKGADPSMCNDDKIMPAHQAASEGHVQCLKALVEVGAIIDSRDARGHLPIDLAKLWGHRKCARILAAESWHQSKEFLAKEMKQLQKLQMQQALDDINADESNKADQQFYGDLAFNEWLQNRGMSKTPEAGKPKTAEKNKDNKPKLRTAPREATHKANSYQPPKAPTPITEEESLLSSQQQQQQQQQQPRKVQYASRQHSSRSGSPYTKASSDDSGLYEKPAANSPSAEMEAHQDNAEQEYYQTIMWNKSTKIPGKDYTKNLEDHYPHDEYTMQPVDPPKRFAHSPTRVLDSAASAGKRMPRLPPDIIKKKLEPGKYERPVVYKCKHISDTHKKFIPDEVPKQEAAMHLCNDPNSQLFRNALTIDTSPCTPSTAISGMSRASSGWSHRQQPEFMHLIKRIGKVPHYPDVKGEEYDINFGQVAAI